MRISSEQSAAPEPAVPAGPTVLAGPTSPARPIVAAGPTYLAGPRVRPPAPQPPAATVTVCPDGPILVRGDFELLDGEGRPMPRGRATIALCRCGFSRLAPLCDGTHKVAGFRCGDRVEGADA